MPVVHLTQKFIDNELYCPENRRRIELIADDSSQFFVEVRSSSQGSGTYYQRYQDPDTGKTCTIKIGRTTDMDLTSALKESKRIRGEVALNRNPATERNAKKSIPTLSDFFDLHYKPYAEPRKRSFKYDETMFKRIRPVYGHLRMDLIQRRQLQEFHTSLLNERLAPATCDHYLKLIKYMYNLAIRWDMVEHNPASKIPLYNPDNKVQNTLTDNQLKSLIQAIKNDNNDTVSNICLFALATGCRQGEALNAKWSQIQKKNHIWTLDSSSNKSKRQKSIPLNSSAMMVIDSLRTENSSDYLFPSERSKLPYTNIQKAWNRIRNAAGLPHLRFHDLRHEAASRAVSAGTSLYSVQQWLGHSDPKVTQRYAHLSNAAVMEAANHVSDAIQKAMNDE